MSFVDKSPRSTSEQEDYKTLAMQKTVIRGREILTYAPFRLAHSAYHTLSPWQEVIGLAALLALFYAILVEVIHQDSFLLVVAIGLLTFLYLAHLVISVVLAIAAVSRSGDVSDRGVTRKDALTHKGDWPTYTILCPLYKEVTIVKQFIRAMLNLDYPVDKLQILLLIEEDDLQTRAILSCLHLPQHFSIVTVPAGSPRTKPRACNYGLLKATGAYVVIYDAEDIPEPWQLKMAALTFARGDANLACVQAQLNTYNPRQNILTRLFTLEYSLWFDLVLPGLTRLGAAIPLGGTSNHFRADVLRALGAWDAYNVTEDADLGMRLSQYGFTVKMIESTTYEEATSRIGNWIRQRSRWIKGYIQTYFMQWRRPEKLPRKRMALLHFTIGATVLFFLLNPLMWILTGIYILDRVQVEALYHVLFPTPVLYAGMFCLIFGNVFYVYVAMIAAMRREQYSLVKWCLLLPLYWAMIFVAAVKAVFQLMMKPHYWEKTVHGSHLTHDAQRANEPLFRGKEGFVVEMEETQLVPIVEIVDKKEMPRLTQVVKAVKAPGKPGGKAVTSRKRHLPRYIDPGLILTMGTAIIFSLAALVYFYSQHDIMLYGDSHSHMRIARSVFDSATPGLFQLGTVWLPLPHILMWPFIWSDSLWHSGLAGSFVSMICFVISACFLYCIAYHLTKSRSASFMGVLIFVSNPNILYLQVTPLSEIVCIAAFTSTIYFFLQWVETDRLYYLIITAGGAFLGTLARYDGWALCMILLVVIGCIGVLRHHGINRTFAQLIAYGFVGCLGMILWFIWNGLLFGDPRYFQSGPYSAAAQQLGYLQTNTLYTYHSVWEALRYYTLTVIANIGIVPVLLAVSILLIMIVKYWRKPLQLVPLVILTPFAFYILSLYTGQAVIHLPAALPPGTPFKLFNVRYGVQMLAPIAILIALGVSWIPWQRFFVGHVIILILVGLQLFLLSTSGIVSLQEGINNTCENPQKQINLYLAQHYNGGLILQDVFTSAGFDASDAGIDFKNVIYQGSQKLWQQALRDPASVVTWVSFDPNNTTDQVSNSPGRHSFLFLQQFTLMLQEPNGRQLYYRKDGPMLPTRPIPPSLLAPYQYCTEKAKTANLI